METGEVNGPAETQEAEEIEDEELILMDSCPYIISFLSEFCAMTIQMFVGCLGSIETFGIEPIITTFSFGMGRLACYEIFNHISPVHVNPAKSFGFVILGRMHPMRFLIYILAQFLGSTVGVAIVMAVGPPDSGVCLVYPHGVKPAQAFGMEFGHTMILMLMVAAATDPLNAHNMDTMNLRMAFVVTVLIFSMDFYTGAGKNPARSLAPSLLYNHWQDHWLYVVGPFAGATLGALMYRFIFDWRSKYSVHSQLLKLQRRVT